ncbi:hypothetical protein F3Y22_tig00110163pilonHSYRG00055 [Hibiscus syriacus]|uniref:Uncharacterized protein n=1 Tax=Hibiscus syriacus TaxID=106335 RepID=A0A6A3BHX8_HIBSY|nr:hypothetical protein F3Y22_tig00110163pilonHSYRG00055 [Hibiscus syriacus]
MSQSNLILAGTLLLILLLTYGATISEGIRVFEAEKLDGPGNHVTKMMSGQNRNTLEDASEGVVHNAYRTNDVRPTPHGHSPGAGHSTGPASNDNN